jgi:hypothetical protein
MAKSRTRGTALLAKIWKELENQWACFSNGTQKKLDEIWQHMGII